MFGAATWEALMKHLRFALATTSLVLGITLASVGRAQPLPTDLSAAYHKQVVPTLSPPDEAKIYYGELARKTLDAAHIYLLADQYVLVVDRNSHVQASLLYLMSPDTPPSFIGAAPVSTGRVGQFDHFETPLGVFPHELANPDFRALGTKNVNGIRGYGQKGMRVFDLGWQQATRGWGNGGPGTMRLQMHATDPDRLESKLGTPQSEGCIRMPSTLNQFLDHFGVLDADYALATAMGPTLWVLPHDQDPVPNPGRYIVIVDSAQHARPAWSPIPKALASTPAHDAIASRK